MSRGVVGMREAQRMYERLRRAYFLDGVNFPANELRWTWLPANSNAIAETWFEDREPDEVRISARCERDMKADLIHELAHMRLGPDVSCRRSRAWKQEQVRLAQLGAPLL